MALFENLNKRFEREEDDFEEKDLDPRDLGGSADVIFPFADWQQKNTTELLEASGVGWAYACMDAIANDVASIELRLLRYRSGKDDELYEHPVIDILTLANPFTTKFDLFYLTQQYLDATGEAPWFLKFENGTPAGIYLLRPDRITIKESNKPDELIGGYTYRVYGVGGYKEVDLEPKEVIFLKYPDPLNPLRGRSVLNAAARAFDSEVMAEKYNWRFFENSATPSAVLSSPKVLSEETKRKLRNELKIKYQGFDNSHKSMILDGGLEWKPMAVSQKDMEFIESMKFTRDKILAIFRVPRTVLGITDDVNRANAEASDYTFAKRTIKPRMEKLVQMLNEFLVPLFDTRGELYLDYIDPVPENIEQNRLVAETGASKGLISVNEARVLLGFDAIDGGDDLITPPAPPTFGGSPEGGDSGDEELDDDSDEEPNPEPDKRLVAQGKRVSGGERKQSLHARTKTHRKRKAIEKQVKKVVADNLSQIVFEQLKLKKRRAKAKKNGVYSKEEKQSYVKKRLRLADELEMRLKHRMNLIFRSQRQEILEKYEANHFAQINVQDEALKTAERLRPVIAEVIKRQSRLAFSLVGGKRKTKAAVALSLRDEVVRAFLAKHVFKVSFEMSQFTNEKLKDLLSKASEEGLSIPQVSKQLRDMFTDFEKYRTDRIARTEIAEASIFASRESYKQSGAVEAEEWFAVRDEATDEDCEALDGAVNNRIGGTFSQGGVTSSGPPEHPNCRCDLLPVLKPL